MNYKDFGGNLPQFSQSNARVRQALPSHYQALPGEGCPQGGVRPFTTTPPPPYLFYGIYSTDFGDSWDCLAAPVFIFYGGKE